MRIYFLLDATKSMRQFHRATRDALNQIMLITRLTGGISVGIGYYKDYCSKTCVFDCISPTENLRRVADFLKAIRLGPGIDWAEASKTGFARSLLHFNSDTLVIHCTDAPPHDHYRGFAAEGMFTRTSHGSLRWPCLTLKGPYNAELAKLGEDLFDWEYLCDRVRKSRARVFTLCNAHIKNFPGNDPYDIAHSYYTYLGEKTNGACVPIDSTTSEYILSAMMTVIFSTISERDSPKKIVRVCS